MSEDIIRVKYFSKYDLANGFNLQRAETILDSFDSEDVYEDINDILELYNIELYIQNGLYLQTWNEEKINTYNDIIKRFPRIYFSFFKQINNNNLLSIFEITDTLYYNDFWLLIEKSDTYKKISNTKIIELITLKPHQLKTILQFEKLTNYYGIDLANLLRQSNQTAEILVECFLIKDNEISYHIPKELQKNEYADIFVNYIKSEDANPNTLSLLLTAPNSADCPVSDKIKLLAKQKMESYWKNVNPSTTKISVKYDDINTIAIIDKSIPQELNITYDEKWIRNNLDYPTLLNNFIFLFDFFDFQWRCTFVSKNYQITPLEKALKTVGKKDYITNFNFDFRQASSFCIMTIYYELLKSKYKINLENIFKWFFETYLKDEFNVKDFVFNAPSEQSTVLEKYRTLCSELDGILKQFKLFVENGEIDRELLEISSEHIVFSTIPSLLKNKYAYVNPNKNSIKNEMILLFSDQNKIFTDNNNHLKYENTYNLLKNEIININEIKPYSQTSIDFLVSQNDLIINENNIIELNFERVNVLKDLYENDVICLKYQLIYKKTIDYMVENQEIEIEDTLFSRPEQDYLNYMLNKAKFSNGLDLRNKYIHGTNTLKIEQQYNDYIELLKIIVLIIGKINEEFTIYSLIKNLDTPLSPFVK